MPSAFQRKVINISTGSWMIRGAHKMMATLDLRKLLGLNIVLGGGRTVAGVGDGGG